MVRFLLGQVVNHVLRRDGRMRAWYKQIKGRRGSKTARVAVMRRLVVIIRQMLTKREPWRPGVKPEPTRSAADDPRTACQPIDRQTVLASYPAPSPSATVARGRTGSSSLFCGQAEVERCQV